MNHWYHRPFMVLIFIYCVFAAIFIMRTVFDAIALYGGELLQTFDSPRLRISQLASLIILSIVNFCILILSNNALLKDLANDSLEKDKMMETLKILAERDGLTGLLNRNAVEQYLDSAVEMTKSGCRCMVTLVDIDNFKLINDTFGHECGDSVLVNLANIFSKSIRESDMVGRWGGDEFLIIHKEITPEQAADLVHRLHQAVESYDWTTVIPAEGAKVSISSGFTICCPTASKRESLRTADLNLYLAKENGRSQSIGP
jgi:diguanylate cyclase (GGDEF)-like protein